MKQETKSIYDFKKGDAITRLKPIIYADGEKDFTFVGKNLTFMGIANASIYLSKDSDFLTAIFTGKESFTIQLPLEVCEEGWGEYIKPDFLEGEEFILDDEKDINSKIKVALDEENYELAESLKKKLDDLRKKGKKGKK